jgi:hypothetical protein
LGSTLLLDKRLSKSASNKEFYTKDFEVLGAGIFALPKHKTLCRKCPFIAKIYIYVLLKKGLSNFN